ncbi:EAL domain-containing protein [Limnofasciculus baicalensis]|uniref:EAL domain-containing protein n=1 Tax=Limnofasciculus baicalensis BBK-W-15 TaxID=2699891 RepID=A0AAE3GS31_9CYAN|nr:EAL domain-containing protein [Limnofasciculus baicalensis]MCP2728808.1 EAL domain-containing protein [Limnofasciculus baicalensis BBK-W-15]
MSEELHLLQTLTQAIGIASDLPSALGVVLDRICELTIWDYGEAWLPRPDNTGLVLSWSTCGNTPSLEKFRLSRKILSFPPNMRLAGRVWTSQQPEWIEDISTEFDEVLLDDRLMEFPEFKAGLAVPILLDNRVLAVLVFFMTKSCPYDQQWSKRVTAITTQLGLAIGRKQLEEQLRQERDFSQAVIETSSAFFVKIDGKGKTIMMNQGLLKALGYTLDEVLGKDFIFTFIAEPDREPLCNKFKQLGKIEQPPLNENWILTKTGEKRLVEWRGKSIFKPTGILDFFFAVGIDITNRRLVDRETKRLASFPLLAPHPIVETDLEGRVSYLNPQAMESLPELMDGNVEHPFLEGILSIKTLVQMQGSLRREVKIDEVYYEQVLHYVPEIDSIRIYAFDISDRKRAEEQLIHDAFYDRLTGLPNRALFMDRLKEAVRRSQQYNNDNSVGQPYRFAVLFLNINRFKLINESLGNQFGDQLLQEFACTLRTSLRTDTIARLGADEFAILLEGIHHVNDATNVACEIGQTLVSPFYLNEQEAFISVSIGIDMNTIRQDTDSEFSNAPQAEELLRNANLAMYHAKANSRLYEVFDLAMDPHAIEKLQLETDLRLAIDREELQVYYQPIVSLLTRKIQGFEALLRWKHPKRGWISPSEFIPIAEETGLITSIGRWTLRESCRQLSIWQKKFPSFPPLTMNVNLSCKQFMEPNLLQHIDQILEETAVAVGSLKLEITESVVIDPKLVKGLIQELKARQIHLCIDDFGTGYSSLSRLHDFPISTLKIDGSFVKNLGALGENSEIIQLIVTLAHTLKMDVVAEGIELLEQVSPLIAMKCQYGQGYLFSRPLDSEAAGNFLSNQWLEIGSRE